MPISRRVLLSGAALAPALAIARAARADGDLRLVERVAGRADAPATAIEFFSLTCTHCARFAEEVFPQVKAKLIEPGRLRYVFRDYPLDQVALQASMVARSLPPERYEPFVMALLATQERWAFAPGANTTEELARTAALAGMPRTSFDRAIGDEGMKKAILAAQQADTKRYAIDSTPTFVFDGAKTRDVKHTGEIDYDAFARKVAAVA